MSWQHVPATTPFFTANTGQSFTTILNWDGSGVPPLTNTVYLMTTVRAKIFFRTVTYNSAVYMPNATVRYYERTGTAGKTSYVTFWLAYQLAETGSQTFTGVTGRTFVANFTWTDTLNAFAQGRDVYLHTTTTNMAVRRTYQQLVTTLNQGTAFIGSHAQYMSFVVLGYQRAPSSALFTARTTGTTGQVLTPISTWAETLTLYAHKFNVFVATTIAAIAITMSETSAIALNHNGTHHYPQYVTYRLNYELAASSESFKDAKTGKEFTPISTWTKTLDTYLDKTLPVYVRTLSRGFAVKLSKTWLITKLHQGTNFKALGYPQYVTYAQLDYQVAPSRTSFTASTGQVFTPVTTWAQTLTFLLMEVQIFVRTLATNTAILMTSTELKALEHTGTHGYTQYVTYYLHYQRAPSAVAFTSTLTGQVFYPIPTWTETIQLLDRGVAVYLRTLTTGHAVQRTATELKELNHDGTHAWPQYVTYTKTVVPQTLTLTGISTRTRTGPGVPTLGPPAGPPGAELVYIPRVVEVYPQPNLTKGRPYGASGKPWLPTVTREVWAKMLLVRVNGQTVSFTPRTRHIPTVVRKWTSQEPFGDASAEILFPGITSFDAIRQPVPFSSGGYAGIAGTHTGKGYWLVSTSGEAVPFGAAPFIGDALALLNAPASGVASHPTADGYWICAQDGGVFTFGAAGFYGSAVGDKPNSPVVGIAAYATGEGYWLVDAGGQVYTFGTRTKYHGNAAVGSARAVGIARSAKGTGYIILDTKGGVHCFGDAVSHGTAKKMYIAPYVAIATAPTVTGYLLVNAKGYSYCQPLGTLVTVIEYDVDHYWAEYKNGARPIRNGARGHTRKVPIETVQVGQRVVSYNFASRSLRRLHAPQVSAVIRRPYSGRLIRVTTESGLSSAYTPEHKCVALMRDALAGKHVVYMMRRGDQYRIGRTQGSPPSQRGSSGLSIRANNEGGDAMWVLSVHDTKEEAHLAEALVGHEYGIPTWQFRAKRQTEQIMDLDVFWGKVGNNSDRAERCLAAFGRDIRFPLWTPDRGVKWTWRPEIIHACNLLDGMRVLPARNAKPQGPQSLCEPESERITVSSEWYEGEVISLDVEGDHTYVGDGIVTHNCFGAVHYESGLNGRAIPVPIVSAWLANSGGYWMMGGAGNVYQFGDVRFWGDIASGGVTIVTTGTTPNSLSWLALGADVTILALYPTGEEVPLFEGVVSDWEDAATAGNIGLVLQVTGCLFQLDWLIAKPITNPPFLGYSPYTFQPVFGWDIGTAIASGINASIFMPTIGTALGARGRSGMPPIPTPQTAAPLPFPTGGPVTTARGRLNTCTPVETGINTVITPQWTKLLSTYIQQLLAQAEVTGGSQWTLHLQRPRTPFITRKNLTGITWTVATGGRGVTLQLSQTVTSSATAIYGQGTAPPVINVLGTQPGELASYHGFVSEWSNLQYPRVADQSYPTWPKTPSFLFKPGDGMLGLQPLTDRLRYCGWPFASQDAYLATDPSKGVADLFLVQRLQVLYGMPQDGYISKAFWENSFSTGSAFVDGKLRTPTFLDVYYAPLWVTPRVEPYTYAPNGILAARNPYFTKHTPRIERFEQMGQMVGKAQGILSATLEGERVNAPMWVGSITLQIDPYSPTPTQRSRFQIVAGQNILLKYFHGRDTLFHINAVDVTFTKQTVKLTVTTIATDLMTMAAIYSRDHEAFGKLRLPRPGLNTLNVTQNVVTFDSESGAGFIPPTLLTTTEWVVIRVPATESGQIAAVTLTCITTTPRSSSNGLPGQFAMGVFAGPVTANVLELTVGNPLLPGDVTNTAGINITGSPWSVYALKGKNGGQGLNALGLLYAAGGPGPGSACGFFPSTPGASQPILTGLYLDGSSWTYNSAPGKAPWLWVAFYLWKVYAGLMQPLGNGHPTKIGVAASRATVSGRLMAAPRTSRAGG